MAETNPTDITSPKDPAVDVHYTNGNLAGNFKFKFKKHIFKWIMGILSASGLGSGVNMYYKYQTLQEQFAAQQKQVYDGVKREADCYKDLQRADELLSTRFGPYPYPPPIDQKSTDVVNKPKQ